MRRPNREKIHVLNGILLMLAVFILPIGYSSFNHDASAGATNYEEQVDGRDLAKLIHKEKIRRIDSFMQAHHNKYNFQGNVLVAHRGHMIYKGSFGYTHPGKKKPVKPEAVFQLASVTKQFTAMAAMIAIEKNLLHYNDTVTRYFPDFPYEGVTVRMLLNHTAGLPNYMWLLEHHWNQERIPYNTDVMELLAKHKLSLHFQPGTRFGYSNTGYVVLASVIEKATNKRFDRFVEQEIFAPLDMENSFVHCAAYPEVGRKHLDGYKYWGRRYRKVPPTVNDGTVGDKGVYSTIEDLYKWDQALYNNTLVSRETMKEALEPVELKNGNHYPYGFGFRLREVAGKKVVYHYGKWNGFRTGIIRYVEDTSTIIILNHTDRPFNSKITRNLRDFLQLG